MCRVLSVSASGYYGWLKKPKSKRTLANEDLLIDIKRIHVENKEAYGVIKVWKVLKQEGIRCGKNRVARLRQIHGIEAKRKCRFRITTQSRKSQRVEPNLLNRCFNVQEPNRIWLGDVTYIATRTGWLYLAVMIDLYSRKVVGWSMSNENNKQLVINALDMALARRCPKGKIIHHTDRGALYGSDDYVQRLRMNNIVQSMSRKGDCYDNAVAESFFSSLKNELVLGKVFESREVARTQIFEYIEVFYNRKRLHQSLGYKSPEKFEQMYLN